MSFYLKKSHQNTAGQGYRCPLLLLAVYSLFVTLMRKLRQPKQYGTAIPLREGEGGKGEGKRGGWRREEEEGREKKKRCNHLRVLDSWMDVQDYHCLLRFLSLGSKFLICRLDRQTRSEAPGIYLQLLIFFSYFLKFITFFDTPIRPSIMKKSTIINLINPKRLDLT